MKKIILVFIIFLLISCEYNPDKKSIIKVIKIENSIDSEFGIYRYTLLTSSSTMQKTYLYSDSIYKLNDTLIIIKK